MAIAGAPLLSCCGDKAPGPERRRSVGEARDERQLTGGVPRKGFDIHTDGSGAGMYGNLQPCSDTSGCGQNVGWIGTGGTPQLGADRFFTPKLAERIKGLYGVAARIEFAEVAALVDNAAARAA